jgi:hypothetical protein
VTGSSELDGDDSPTQMIDVATHVMPRADPEQTSRIQRPPAPPESPPGRHRR